MTTEKANKLALRIYDELGLKISSDDPVLSLMVFQEQQTEKMTDEFKRNQMFFMRSITEKLIKAGKPKKTTTLITALIVVNIILTIFSVILGLERVLNG
jgi:hypothetical protein